MGTLGNPKIWVPYINPRDCSQGFCTLSCPQWCYLIFPPPPPLFSFPVDDTSSSSSGSTFSPLVIIIMGVLVSAFVLVSYYMIISMYCGNSKPSTRVDEHQSDPLDEEEEEHDERGNTNEHEAWVIRTVGLAEALIKSITLVNYKKGDGLVGSGDCSVCLGEFQEDESLRLLPKCGHAFHVECIDTWLRSHSNCPLCRATLFSTSTQPPNLVVDNTNNHHQPPQDHEPSTQTHVENEEIRSCDQEGASRRENLPKCPSRVFSPLGQGGVEGHIMRRSMSMDHFHETRLSISDILRFDSEEATAGESSSSSLSNDTSENGVLHSVMNSMAMKRSFSSGRFLFTKHGRGRNAVIPL